MLENDAGEIFIKPEMLYGMFNWASKFAEALFGGTVSCAFKLSLSMGMSVQKKYSDPTRLCGCFLAPIFYSIFNSSPHYRLVPLSKETAMFAAAGFLLQNSSEAYKNTDKRPRQNVV